MLVEPAFEPHRSYKTRGCGVNRVAGSKPPDWVSFVNQALTVKELEDLRLSAQRGRPFGNENWRKGIAARLGLESTLRPRGRPRKEK